MGLQLVSRIRQTVRGQIEVNQIVSLECREFDVEFFDKLGRAVSTGLARSHRGQ